MAQAERGKLGAVFEEVQRRKNEVQAEGVTPELAERIKDKLRAELGEMPDDRLERFYQLTIGGMAWVAKMLTDRDLSFLEAWGVAESLSDTLMSNTQGIQLDVKGGIDLGVGAGLYTGMWMGFLLSEEERDG